MNGQFAYARPPVYHYQTFDRTSLQFTNHPIIAKRPRAPSFAKQDAEESEGETSKDDKKDGAKEEEEAASQDVVDTNAGQLLKL